MESNEEGISSDREAEHSLVKRLKENSADAFEDLVARYARRLYSVSVRILRNPQDAEDAVQETFLIAFQNIETFREESSLYTWLYRIAYNQALMKLKRQARQEVVPIEPYLPRFEHGQHAEQIHDWSRVPDVVLQNQELSEFFEKCIDGLPEELRIAYILKDVEKLSEERVCEILQINKATMKNRVHTARLVIRKRVEKHFFSRN